MKLLRYGAKGAEKPALVDARGVVRDLSGELADIAAETLRPPSLKRLAALDAARLPAVESPGRIAPPWSGCAKFVCIGLNYSDHAAETGSPIPKEPIIFMKPISAIVGCNDAVVLPKDSIKTDWEVELGIVIGATARYVEQADALDHVAGYCVVNDVSEREYQLERGGTWDKGKGCDTFGPDRAVDGDTRRSARPAGARHVARRERQAHAGRQHQDDDLRRCRTRRLLQPLHDALPPATSSAPARRPASASA